MSHSELFLEKLKFGGLVSSNEIVEALENTGAVLVYGALPTESFSFWRDALELIRKVDDFAAFHGSHHYDGSFNSVSKLLAVAGIEHDVNFFRRMFCDAGLHTIAKRYFERKNRFFEDLNPLYTQRRIRGLSGNELLGYHMDLGYLQSGMESLTVWVPMHDVDPDDCASLEVIAHKISNPLAFFSTNNIEDLRLIDESKIPFELKNKSLPTKLSAGDVLIFNEKILHRTIGLPNRKKFRYSFDFRYVSPANNSSDQRGRFSFPHPSAAAELFGRIKRKFYG